MDKTLRTLLIISYDRAAGRGILARLDELNRTQWLSHSELEAMQAAKLHALLDYAYRWVPYYRRLFDETGLTPTDVRRDPACFARLPILTKAIIRANRQALQTSEPVRRRSLTALATSGSTGEPLSFLQDSPYRDAVTADIQRHIGWAGWKLGEPQAFIWGAKLHPNLRQRLRLGLIDRVWNRFQMDAFTLSHAAMQSFAQQAKQRRPRILFGYPTGILMFARYIRSSVYAGLNFDAVFTTAERLLPAVRSEIEETFQARVFDRYGTLELGGVACECEAHDGMHVSVENNLVEILVDGIPAAPNQTGDVIVTNLNNYGMPFIRYQVGDLAAAAPYAPCACGRSAQKLATVEGRSVEALRAADGHLVWGGFAGAPWRCLTHPSIRQFQVRQQALDHLIFRLAPSGQVPADVLNQIRSAVSHTFGNCVQVDFEFVDDITPLPSGKHTYVVSELSRA